MPSRPNDKADTKALPIGAVRRQVERHRGEVTSRISDAVAEELPVALIYNERPHAVMMCTPVDLEDFALGFSLSEGIIDDAGEFEERAHRTRAGRHGNPHPRSGIARRRARSARAPAHRPHRLRTVRRADARSGRASSGAGAGAGDVHRRRVASRDRRIAQPPDHQHRHRRHARGGVGVAERIRRTRARRRRPPQRARQTHRRDDSATAPTCGRVSCSSPAAAATRW